MRSYTAAQIEVVKQRIRRTCFALQALFVFDLARRISLLCGRGAGKTSAELMRMVLAMVTTDHANCIYIASTRESAERLAWKDLKRIVSTLRLAGAVFNESKLTLKLPNGASLLLFGADAIDDIEKLRGITWHEVAIDEVASIKITLLQYLLFEVIGPRAIGAIVLLGTAGKRLEGLFYDATRPGSEHHRPYADRDLPEYANWLKWSSHTWTIEDGVAAGVAAMIILNAVQLEDKERNGWSDTNPIWLRERKAEWAADDTSNVYIYRPYKEDGKTEHNQWDPEHTPFGMAILPPTHRDWGYGIGMDVGWKDAFALEVFAWSYSARSRTLWHVYEVYRTRLSARDLAMMLIGEDLNHNKYAGIIGEIGWPDVMVGDFDGAGGWLLKELAQVYGIIVKPADKPYRYKDNAIALYNGELHDGRIRVMKGSNLAREMMTLQWVVDQYGKRIENKAQANHACDASMYLRNEVAPMLPAATGGDDQAEPLVPHDLDDPVGDIMPPQGDADSMYRLDDILP